MKRLIVLLAFALPVGFASAKPDDPPGARGIPPAKVKVPKAAGVDKAPASVQGGVRSHGRGQVKTGGSAPAEELLFNPPKK